MLGPHQQNRSQCSDTLGTTDAAQVVGGGGLHIDLLARHAAVGGDVGHHLRRMRREPRRLGDHRRVEVAQRIAGGMRLLAHAAQQVAAVGVLVGRVGVGKVGADVTGAERAEDGVANRVQQCVGVGMAVQTPRVGYGHPAQYQTPPRDQRMRVEAVADAQRQRRHAPFWRWPRIASASATSSL